MFRVRADYIETILMTDRAARSSGLLVVLAPRYGEKLTDVWPGRSVWIAMSPSNEPVVRSHWAASIKNDAGDTLTGFLIGEDIPPEIGFLRQLDNIELHQARHSVGDPYRLIEVVGCSLTDEVRAALCNLGFFEFREHEDGFVASRTKEEANRLR